MARRWQVKSGRRMRSLAIGVAASAVSATPSQAAVIYNLVNNQLNNEGLVNNLEVDFDRNGTPEASFVLNNDGSGMQSLSLNPLNNDFGWLLPASGNPLRNNELIGPGNNFLTNNANLATLNNNQLAVNEALINANGESFIGFNFNLGGIRTTGPGAAAADDFHGWMRIDLDPSSLNLTLTDYAFEDRPGATIAAGATAPAPSTLALLALGAAGLAAWRRRRATPAA